ncbi:MAG TPA: serine/threonine-protein kinase [Kofleriaceae bacterium]
MPNKLGKFELIRPLATGGMAELYLARTTGLEGFEKVVVVKRMLPQYAKDQAYVAMFLAEARLSATLHHPNIAQVYDIGIEDGEYFFSMEYVHGEDLGHLHDAAQQQGVPMSLDAVLTLATGLCAGLHYAHEKTGPDGKPLGVVHRDVSPSNVLVSYDGGVKLVDFGIARAGNSPRTTNGGLKGKVDYMSPEQCRGSATLDRRSDIYSIGTLLYELTTGQRPFTGASEFALLEQIVHEDAPSPTRLVPDYPPALAAIVEKALARDPNKRFATALEMQGQLEDFAHETRLRISPLVLVRVMSSLFPARLEEWDQARAQGAFFVEQHIMSTLTGREEEVASPVVARGSQPRAPFLDPAAPAMKTAPMIPAPQNGFQGAPLDDDALTLRRTPSPDQRAAIDAAVAAAQAQSAQVQPFAPPASFPPSRSFVPTSAPAYAPAGGGVLVSNHVPSAVEPHHAIEVTERVFFPKPRSEAPVRTKSRAPMILAVAVLIVGAAIGGYWYLENRNIEPLPTPPAVTPEPAAASIDAAPEVDAVVEVDAAVVEVDAAPEVDAAVEEVKQPDEPPKTIKTTLPAKKPPKKLVPKKMPKKPAKGGQPWNADSPFLPGQ